MITCLELIRELLLECYPVILETLKNDISHEDLLNSNTGLIYDRLYTNINKNKNKSKRIYDGRVENNYSKKYDFRITFYGGDIYISINIILNDLPDINVRVQAINNDVNYNLDISEIFNLDKETETYLYMIDTKNLLKEKVEFIDKELYKIY